jgi:hypothetical protein
MMSGIAIAPGPAEEVTYTSAIPSHPIFDASLPRPAPKEKPFRGVASVSVGDFGKKFEEFREIVKFCQPAFR